MTPRPPLRLVHAFFSLAGLAGCGATALQPGAARVLVTRQPPSEECRYLGTVIGEQGGWLTGPLTSNKNLTEGAVNDMKNKAQDLGANYVELETTNAGNTLSGSGGNVTGQQTDVTHMGNAFHCPDGSRAAPEASR
jgi:Domain of unknown function (DUF4156)